MFLVLIFLASLAVTLGAALLVTRPSRDAETLGDRLEDLYKARSQASEGPSALRIAENASEAVSALQRALRHRAFNGLRTLLAQSQSTMTPASFLLRSMVVGLVLAFAAGFALPMLVVRLAALALGVSLPALLLRRRRNKRLRQFEEALPDAADLMGRALRAGHSVQQALEVIATESKGPLADEFSQLHQEQKFGVPLREALRALALRVPSADLQFLVTAIIVQKETGGDLIEILDRTTQVIRGRLRVEREVKTYTAQGRLTGWILSALPVVLLALTAMITPAYNAVLFHDPTGQMLLMIAAGLITTGSFIIRRVVRVEV